MTDNEHKPEPQKPANTFPISQRTFVALLIAGMAAIYLSLIWVIVSRGHG
ncbi:MAG: hypothetical protein HY804_10390 [Nitrospinae bacterium]|nr:hypothetical protein [Nitrospinota bacterium]